MKILLINLFFCIVHLTILAQNEELKWQENTPLSWDHFQGIPEEGTNEKSATVWRLSCPYNINNHEMTVTVNAYFKINKSWVIEKTDALLHHEQGHFDLVEIYARELMKKVSKYKFQNKSTKLISKEVNALLRDATRECQTELKLYHKETFENPENQAEWDKKIEKRLKVLEKYKS